MTRLAGRMVVRPAAAATALLAGLALRLFVPNPAIAHVVWTAGLWLTGIPLLVRTTTGAIRGRLAADLVAALAVAGAIAFDQPFAGLVIVLMQTGGEALEHYAERRASAAVRKLEEDAPHTANRIAEGRGPGPEPGALAERRAPSVEPRIETVPASEIEVGELVLVRPGEMVPTDGVVESGTSQVDVARLTGEPLPQHAGPGSELRSGSIVTTGPLRVRVTARAEASLYARIVELVRTAQASKAPLQRIADRYALWFTPITVAVALLALAISRDPLRMLAVLVVATPCPLILATPVAIIGGINRAARRQIIVRHGGALEALAAVDTAVFDKTGTLTVGRPEVAAVHAVPPFTEPELLRLAGAVEQGSGHLLARTLVQAAESRGIELPRATEVIEEAGRGVVGTVEGKRVRVGAFSLITAREPAAALALHRLHDGGPALRAFVAVDGAPAGSITYADRLRTGAADSIRALRQLGIEAIALLSGDHVQNVAAVGRAVGIEDIHADLLPEDKVRYAERLGARARKVLMVGDGINDAPALSAASVGIALAAHGGGIAAEAADVVLLTDRLNRVPEAVSIGRRTIRIARQSILVGLGLSGLAMVVAALGYLPPAVGALVQEGIDVGVIVNALRTSGAGRSSMTSPSGVLLDPFMVAKAS